MIQVDCPKKIQFRTAPAVLQHSNGITLLKQLRAGLDQRNGQLTGLKEWTQEELEALKTFDFGPVGSLSYLIEAARDLNKKNWLPVYYFGLNASVQEKMKPGLFLHKWALANSESYFFAKGLLNKSLTEEKVMIETNLSPSGKNDNPGDVACKEAGQRKGILTEKGKPDTLFVRLIPRKLKANPLNVPVPGSRTRLIQYSSALARMERKRHREFVFELMQNPSIIPPSFSELNEAMSFLFKKMPDHAFLLGLAFNKEKNKNELFRQLLLSHAIQNPDTKFAENVVDGLEVFSLENLKEINSFLSIGSSASTRLAVALNRNENYRKSNESIEELARQRKAMEQLFRQQQAAKELLKQNEKTLGNILGVYQASTEQILTLLGVPNFKTALEVGSYIALDPITLSKVAKWVRKHEGSSIPKFSRLANRLAKRPEFRKY